MQNILLSYIYKWNRYYYENLNIVPFKDKKSIRHTVETSKYFYNKKGAFFYRVSGKKADSYKIVKLIINPEYISEGFEIAEQFLGRLVKKAVMNKIPTIYWTIRDTVNEPMKEFVRKHFYDAGRAQFQGGRGKPLDPSLCYYTIYKIDVKF